MTKDKRKELIGIAVVEGYSCGNLHRLYDEDVLEEHGMEEHEMEAFLEENTKIINEVEVSITSKIDQLVELEKGE